MAYVPNTWVARQGTGLNKYTDAATGQVLELQSTPDSITQQGTPFSADWMNHIEQGIADVYNISALACTQTLPVADDVTVNAGDVVDVVDGEVVNTVNAVTSAAKLSSAALPTNTFSRVVQLNDSTIFVAYGLSASPYLAIAIYDISSDVPALLDSMTITVSGPIENLSLGRLSSSKVAIVYIADGNSNAFIYIAEINNNSINLGERIINTGSYGIFLEVGVFSETQFVIITSSGNTSKFVPVTCSGLTCTMGTGLSGVYGVFINTEHSITLPLSSNVILFGGSTSSVSRFYMVKINGTGTEATIALSSAVDIGFDGSVFAAQINPNTLVLGGAYYSMSYNCQIQAVTFDVDNLSTTVIAGPTQLAFNITRPVACYAEDIDGETNIHCFCKPTDLSVWCDAVITFDGSAFVMGTRTEIYGVPNFESAPLYIDAFVKSNLPVIFGSITNDGLNLFWNYNKTGSYQAIALASGTAGQLVKIGYSGTFELDGITAGESIYDSRGFLAAYCPFDGTIDVIGYWARNSYVFGTFTGNNNSSQTIDLGFKPSAVIVQIQNENNTITIATGFGFTTSLYTKGGNNKLQISDNGFTVFLNASSSVYTNSNVGTYSYIAFK